MEEGVLREKGGSVEEGVLREKGGREEGVVTSFKLQRLG